MSVRLERDAMAIPKYAERTPPEKRVQIVCRGKCGAVSYAEVSKVPWKGVEPFSDPDLYAECLRCSYRARDNYNWIEQ